jgi:hypothetical protein
VHSHKTWWLAGSLLVSSLLGTAALLKHDFDVGRGLASSMKACETVVNHHFQAIATNRFAAAMADYGPELFQQRKQEDWQKALSGIHHRLGAYKSHKITNSRIFTQPGSGTTVVLQCEVRYANFSGTERFTLFKGLRESEYRIVSHTPPLC